MVLLADFEYKELYYDMSIITFISLHLLLQSSPYGLAYYPSYLLLQLSFQWQGMWYKLGRNCTHQSCSILVAVVDSIESHWNLPLHNECKSPSASTFCLCCCSTSTPSQLVIHQLHFLLRQHLAQTMTIIK